MTITVSNATQNEKPHIVLVIPRGEAVRNFLYSDTLHVLGEKARVTLLSVIHDRPFRRRFGPCVEQIVPLQEQEEHRLVSNVRRLLHEAHFRWLWSKVAQNAWELRDYHADTPYKKLRWLLFRSGARLLAHRCLLEPLTELERALSWRLRPDDRFVELFQTLQPDLVFNGSHIHGRAGELPVKIAHRMGIPTAGFIFSWDNLTSRSRIFVPYDTYFVWHEGMKRQLLDIYPRIDPGRVFVTGTPQFDFHFKPQFHLSREELAQEMGIDVARPYILYTTGIDRHFPREHRHVAFIADFLEAEYPDLQMVVRTYVKGTSKEMKALAKENRPNLVFPETLWEEEWKTPMYDDLANYSSLLRHTVFGINPASTVTLELLMHDKPVMNIGFDPPGSDLPHPLRWIRHIEFDHFAPVAGSKAVRVAYSTDDVEQIISEGLQNPNKRSGARQQFIRRTFADTLDGCAGARVAQALTSLTSSC